MDFSWTHEQQRLYEAIAAFAELELNADIVTQEREGRFLRDKWRRCADMGVLGLAIPEEYGGLGCDVLTTMYALEGLGYGCRDNGLIFAMNAQMWAVQAPLLRFGSDAQKAMYLTRLVSGEFVGAHGISESESGSDTFAMSTRAERRGSRYVLNGSKTWVSNAPIADVFLLFAVTGRRRGFLGVTAFVIEKGTPGLRTGKPIEKMGLRTSPMSEVFLEDCEVDEACRLGREGNGGTIFLHSMAWERCCILASVIGTMEHQLAACTDYAKTRRQFGQHIGRFQSVANMLVDMRLRLDTTRLLLYRAGWLRAQGHEAATEVALAKLHLSEAYVASSLQAIQIFGGSGYASDTGIEHDLRDAVGSRIYSGTSEMQRDIIARSMGM